MKRKRPLTSSKVRHQAISLDSGHLQGPWPGHFPVTSVAMMALLARLADGDVQFSPAERIIFVACEFWSALNAGELDSHFDLKAEDPTRDARIALRIVGAAKTASFLEFGVLGRPGGRAVFRRRRRLVSLEERLRGVSEPVDLLIARFAWRYMSTQRRPSMEMPFHPPPGAAEPRHDPSIAD